MTVWLLGQGGLRAVMKAGADPRWLRSAYTLQRISSVTAAVANVPVYNFKGLAACQAAPPRGFTWALYSQDSTSENSLWEMTHIARAHEQACALLHAQGLMVLAFPANDIVWKMPPVPHSDQYEAFISRNIAGDAARHADSVGVQSQGLTADAAAFAWYIQRAHAQARSARPGIPFFGGLATERLGTLITAGQMHAAYDATSDLCDGYWLNVNGRPEVAVEFLRLVYG